MYGFHGKYLHIALDSVTARSVPLRQDVLHHCLGGIGLGCWLLAHTCRQVYDPLAPQAPLVFAFAPLAGTALNTTAKAAVLSKSPLTQRLNDAMVSSRFALAGKGTGYDALMITGACAAWSTLFVDPQGMALRATPALLGLTAEDAARRIRAEWGQDWSVVAIGVAGEHLVPYALLSHDGRHAGRGGTGAVMGAKRLKAIAVRGGVPTRVARPQRFHELREWLKAESLGNATEKYRTTGTLGNLLVFNRLGILPGDNFRSASHESAERLSAELLFTEHRVQRTTCADCMIGCEKRYTTANGHSVRLEYENFFALGPLLGIWEPEAVVEASRLCDEYGLDTITTGGTLAFAMECVQRGLLELPGLARPDASVVADAIAKIARREGYGALLALGSREMARRIGGGSEAFAPQIKGLEMPGYHPAHLQTLALGLAVGSRGADHNKSGAYDLDLSGRVDPYRLDVERVEAMVALEDQAALIDSLILCKFVRRALPDLYEQAAEILTALTGEAFDAPRLRRTAAAIHHLRKLFNQRQGWSSEEDTLPQRFFLEPGTPGEGIDRMQFLAARGRYYALRGWDAQGRLPAAATLMPGLESS